MSDAKKAALIAAKNTVRPNLAPINPLAGRASVTSAGTSNTVFGVPLGFVLVGVAVLGVVGVIVLRRAR